MKKIYIFAVAAMILTACDKNEDNPNPASGAAIITATIGESTVTRAIDEDWDKNDAIGISSTVGGADGPYFNVKYTTEKGDGKFTGETPIYFYQSMTLTAYYPFAGPEDEVPGTDGVISAYTRPENQTKTNQPKIDFLWDSKSGVDKKDFFAAEPKVNFTFAHKMSKLTFIFQSSDPVYDKDNKDLMISDGVDVATMISYKIEGLGVEGTFNTSTGVCALSDESVREGLEITFGKEISAEKMKERVFDPLIVFPQKKPENGFILHITTDELNKEDAGAVYVHQKYKCALRFTNDEIKAGCHYKFTVKVTKVGLIVGKLEIEPWSEEEKFMVATIDGDPGFKHQQQENPETGD